MYQVYVEKESDFSPNMVGEYKELEQAQARAKREKERNSEIAYTIEETDGSFNSYGDLVTTVIERG